MPPSQMSCHCSLSRVTCRRHAVTRRVSYTGEARTILGCPLSPGEAVTAEAGGTKTISEQKNKLNFPPSQSAAPRPAAQRWQPLCWRRCAAAACCEARCHGTTDAARRPAPPRRAGAGGGEDEGAGGDQEQEPGGGAAGAEMLTW